MITYITAFIFYTLAMIGILLVGFVIYKKTFVVSKGENKGMIKILDSYPIGPKKVLMVVKIRNERFLIASGVEHTTFLAKLSDKGADKTTDKGAEETVSRAQTVGQAIGQTIEQLVAQPAQKIKTQNIKNVPKMEEIPSEVHNRRMISEEEIQRRFDEMEEKQAHLDRVQKQFEELYRKEEMKEKASNSAFSGRTKLQNKLEQEEAFKKAPQRREMIRKLLNEINETKTVKTGRI